MVNKQAKKRWLMIFGSATILLLVLFFAFYLPWKNRAKAPTDNNKGSVSSEVKTKQTVSTQDNDNETAQAPSDYYTKGETALDDKNYQKAIENFDNAISEDPKNADYYIKKSQSEYNLGQKQAAIDTLKEGINQIPNNGELTSRLDTLERTQTEPLGSNFQ